MEEIAGIWWGKFTSDTQGDNFGGVALAVDHDQPNWGRLLVSEHLPTSRYFHARVQPDIDGDKIAISANELIDIYGIQIPDEVNPSQSVQIDGNITSKGPKKSIVGTWSTDVNTRGKFELHLDELIQSNPPNTVFKEWKKFREWALESKKDHSGLVFRGVSNSSYNLITSFHRTGRRDLVRYKESDIRRLYRYLSPMLPRTYNLKDPIEFSAFLFLAQHHGFPTPLLDWTESPFIAAFFAFWSRRNKGLLRSSEEDSDMVRIYEFNRALWPEYEFNPTTMIHPEPLFGFHDLVGFDNPRSLPQQSVVSFSNICDIESWIRSMELNHGKEYLHVYDIPAKFGDDVLRELDVMGINESTLFPGIEGTCRRLRWKHF